MGIIMKNDVCYTGGSNTEKLDKVVLLAPSAITANTDYTFTSSYTDFDYIKIFATNLTGDYIRCVAALESPYNINGILLSFYDGSTWTASMKVELTTSTTLHTGSIEETGSAFTSDSKITAVGYKYHRLAITKDTYNIGTYPDYSQIITSGSYVTDFTYTATQACFISISTSGNNDYSGYVMIDGYWVASQYVQTVNSNNARYLLPLAKGQVLVAKSHSSYAETYTVYRAKSSTASVDATIQPVIYSDTEREVGVWRDGKPLYQKTVYYVGGQSGNVSFNHNIANIDMPVKVEGVATDNEMANTFQLIPRSDKDGNIVMTAEVNRTQITYAVSQAFSTRIVNLYFTVWYTKTTDTPGSGTWTPSGVPAVHYSTDEQVIGTWVDGRPVYEVTLTVATTTQFNNVSWTAIPFSETEPIGVDFIIDAVTTTNPPTNSQFRFKYENGHFCGASIDIDSVGQGSYCIFRYVKTTS